MNIRLKKLEKRGNQKNTRQKQWEYRRIIFQKKCFLDTSNFFFVITPFSSIALQMMMTEAEVNTVIFFFLCFNIIEKKNMKKISVIYISPEVHLAFSSQPLG